MQIEIVCLGGGRMGGATSKQELLGTKLYKYNYILTQIQLQSITNTITT